MKMGAHGALKGVESGRCGCVKGNAVCHHMIALLLNAHYLVTCTDVAQRWSLPAERGDRNTGNKVSDLFPPSQPSYRALTLPLTDHDFNFALRCSGMCGDGAAGALWLLSPPPADVKDDRLIYVKDFILSSEFISSTNKKLSLEIFLKVSTEEIVAIAQRTVGQRKNSLWLKGRIHRITASKFGEVLKTIEKNRKPCKSLMKTFLEGNTVPAPSITNKKKPPKPGSSVHALNWGNDNEGPAAKMFEKKSGLQVICVTSYSINEAIAYVTLCFSPVDRL